MNPLVDIVSIIALAQPHDAAPKTVEHVAAHSEKAGVIPTIAQGIVPAIVALLVFAVVFIVLKIKVWPNIIKGLQDRENKIKEEIESAEAARVQAKMALEQYERSLSEARAEAQKMIDQAKVQQASQIAEMKSRADAELAGMKAKAIADIESAKKQALSEIYTQTASLASNVAGKILKREVNAGDQSRLVEEAIAGLGTRH